jgi:hypothetical protein
MLEVRIAATIADHTVLRRLDTVAMEVFYVERAQCGKSPT